MYQRYEGDRVGEIDEDGIAEWYPKCKVRKEGNVFIATPHTTNPTRRSVRKIEPITVSLQDGKYKLEEDNLCGLNPVKSEIEQGEKQDNKTTLVTTRKDLFDELYDKYSDLLQHERKQAVLSDMLPLFKSKEDAEDFMSVQWRRRRRNNYMRKKRFEYKAYNQAYQYFFTITYDDKKQTEQSFERKLKNAFSNLHKRHGCLFQGVWERGEEHGRLHFHGLIFDPERKILDGLETVTDYNPQTGRTKTYLHSPYFADKFGRNEFSEIIPQMYDSAIRYITKYLSKQSAKPYYSQGLYSFLEADICGKDVICKMSEDVNKDVRLIVANDFTIWQDGERIGEASPETIAQVPKLP